MELIRQYQKLSILYLEKGLINTAEYYNNLAIQLLQAYDIKRSERT